MFYNDATSLPWWLTQVCWAKTYDEIRKKRRTNQKSHSAKIIKWRNIYLIIRKKPNVQIQRNEFHMAGPYETHVDIGYWNTKIINYAKIGKQYGMYRKFIKPTFSINDYVKIKTRYYFVPVVTKNSTLCDSNRIK